MEANICNIDFDVDWIKIEVTLRWQMTLMSYLTDIDAKHW